VDEPVAVPLTVKLSTLSVPPDATVVPLIAVVELSTSLIKTVDWFANAETLLRSSVRVKVGLGPPLPPQEFTIRE
jgi:hypothetical protein